MQKDAYPLLIIADTLDTMGISKLFTTLDVISRYGQDKLNQNTKRRLHFAPKKVISKSKSINVGFLYTHNITTIVGSRPGRSTVVPLLVLPT